MQFKINYCKHQNNYQLEKYKHSRVRDKETSILKSSVKSIKI